MSPLFCLARNPRSLLIAAGIAVCTLAWGQDDSLAIRMRRGQTLYVTHCSICHQVNGRGSAGVYPPLAGSDYLQGHRKEAILGVVQGQSGTLTVNGKRYDNHMPAIAINDLQVADVLTFVWNSWENPGGTFSEEEVRAVRTESRFKTFDELLKANAYPPVPAAPQGFSIRELLRLNEFVVRMAGNGKGDRLYLLGQNGSVLRLDLATKQLKTLFRAEDYADLERGSAGTLGMTLDPAGHLWISCNQRNDRSQPLVTNEVTIYRTTALSPEGDPASPQLWFRISYPYGIGPYNHGVSHLAFGSDGFLYVSSGSRTDGGEAGNDPRLGTMGETPDTAVMWRFDPGAAAPKPIVIARGIRNAWSFAWDGQRRLFTVSNGPDAHAGEEMDWIRPEQNLHHGFPYQFEDWPISRKAYPHTPEPPQGVVFSHPVKNLGPDGCAPGRPGFTFHPHSSPAGMIWLDAHWPEPIRNSFLVGRFGNLIKGENDIDVGFDVLAVRLEETAGGPLVARTKTWLAPLGRPIDLHISAGNRIYILEYTRPTTFKDQVGWLPGRILEAQALPFTP